MPPPTPAFPMPMYSVSVSAVVDTSDAETQCDSPFIPSGNGVLASDVRYTSSPLRDLGTSGLSDFLETIGNEPLGRSSTRQLDGFLASLTTSGPAVEEPPGLVASTSASALPAVDVPVIPEPPVAPDSSLSPDTGRLVIDEVAASTSDFRESALASSDHGVALLPGN